MIPFRNYPSPRSNTDYLGLATGEHMLVAVGGRGFNHVLVAHGRNRFVAANAPSGYGLRGAHVRGVGDIWVCGTYGMLAHSKDAGHSFDVIKTGVDACLFGFAEDQTGALWVAGDNGVILRSDDGERWRRVRGLREDIGRIRTSSLGALLPTDDGHLYIGDSDGLHRTGIEAGEMLVSAMESRNGTLLSVGRQGHIWRSADAGATWKRSRSGTKATLMGVCQIAEGILVVGYEGTVLLSQDDGRTFAALPQKLASTELWCCASFGPGALVGRPKGKIALVGEAGRVRALPKSPSVKFTHAFMIGAHAGQKDKAGKPYYLHPERVERLLHELFDDVGAKERHVALLHDTVEDTAVTFAYLRSLGYSEGILHSLRLVTKMADDKRSYTAFINDICASGDTCAIKVKLADNADNRSPARLAQLDDKVQKRLRKRYEAAREKLQAALAAK